ncbi:STAS/SEC14 domain-containing protein [Stenotrophomonas maltophilia]
MVTDAHWLKVVAETFSFVSPAKIKVFERAKIDEARQWLAAATA